MNHGEKIQEELDYYKTKQDKQKAKTLTREYLMNEQLNRDKKIK